MTGIGQHRNVVTDFDQPQLEQFAEIIFAYRRHFQTLCLDIPKCPSQRDGTLQIKIGERVWMIRHARSKAAGALIVPPCAKLKANS